MGFERLRAGRRTPLILQTEAAECGLACLAMLAGHYGYELNLGSLRHRFTPSPKGMRLNELMDIAGSLKLSTRPVKLNLAALDQLQLPAMLHWDFNHFVVLTRVGPDSVEILDPARGRCSLPLAEVSAHFTGVALEARPAADFEAKSARQSVSFRQLLGPMPELAKRVGQILLLSATLEIFVILAPLFMQLVVDNAVNARDRDLIVVLALGFALLLLIQILIAASRTWMMTYLGTQINLRLVGNLFQHMLRLPIDFFERRHLGDIVSRFDSVTTIQRTLTDSFLSAGLDGLMAVVTLGMMLFYSVKLSLVVLAATLLYVLLRVALYHPYRLASQEKIVCSARQQSHFLESVRGIQSVKLFNREQARGAAWLNYAIANFNAGIRTQKLNVGYQACNSLLFGLENILVISLGANLILSGGFSVGMLFAFVAFKLQFVSRLGSLVDRTVEYSMLSLHRDRVADIALSTPELDSGLPLLAAQQLEPSIELIDVAFQYAPTEPAVFSKVNLHIAAGECVAITGPSGCGKTTLIKIMLGLLQPTEGEVRIGGVPLRQLGLQAWRQTVGSVMQEDTLFAGSILENISFFDPHVDMERVRTVATMADIDSDIGKMPMAYQTLIGDMGTMLSGGQRQRLMLARALYRQPKLLFLDEATSHLDAARERSVNEAIQQIPLTRVIIAHREETIRMAQRIIQFPLAEATPS